MVLDQYLENSAEAPRPALLSAVVEDASIQASMQPWVEMECYQLSSGRQLTQMDCVDLGSLQVVRETQMAAVQKLGVTPQNLCTLSYCTPDPTFRFSELGTGEADSVFFMPEHTEFDIYVPSGVQTAYVSFDQQAFLQGARTLNPEQWERTPEQLQQLQAAHQSELKAAISLWFNTLGAAHEPADMGLVRRLLLQSILQIAAASTTDDSPPPRAERTRALYICRLARSFVDASLAVDVVPSIVDICAVVGVSERRLQYAFRTYVDMSPLTYLRLCRLNRVRATLRAADPQTTTVTAVAMGFGFFHLGRFALDYKRLFDESPSATLVASSVQFQ